MSGPMTLHEFAARLAPEREGKPIVARFEGDCAGCDNAILPGDVVLWIGKDKATYCATCALEPE